MTVNQLIVDLSKVDYEANYKFAHILFGGTYYVKSYYNTETSFVIQLDTKISYNLNRFRNILYSQKNIPIIIEMPSNYINPTKLQGVILYTEYDLNSEQLTVYFE